MGSPLSIWDGFDRYILLLSFDARRWQNRYPKHEKVPWLSVRSILERQFRVQWGMGRLEPGGGRSPWQTNDPRFRRVLEHLERFTDSVVLLKEARRPLPLLAASVAEAAPAPALAPETTFFEARFFEDAKGEGVADIALELELPSGERRTVKTNSDGVLRVGSLPLGPGSCTLRAQVDGATVDTAWHYQGLLGAVVGEQESLLLHDSPPPKGKRTQLVKVAAHRVQADETVASIAEDYGVSAESLLRFNFGTTEAKATQGLLRDHLGCGRGTEGGEYLFTGSEDPGILFIPRPVEEGGLSLGRTHHIALRGPKRQVERLQSTVAMDQLVGLSKKRSVEFFVPWMMAIFGRDVPADAYRSLFRDLRNGAVENPPIWLRRGVTYEARYNFRLNGIELSQALVHQAAAEKDIASAWKVAGAIVEEFGHHVDWLLRNRYSQVGGDAPMDEGAIYGYSLFNLDWYGKKSAPVGTYTAPGRAPETIEVDWSELHSRIEELYSRAEQASDVRDEEAEYFGAGKGDHAINPHSWGHESIEEVLAPLLRVRSDWHHVYFGNWLRDYSQLIWPPVTKTTQVPNEGFFPAEAMTAVVDVLARNHFQSSSPDFRVTPAKLGEYRYYEHLDNPAVGIPDAPPVAWAIDPERLMGNNIATPGPGYRCAAEYISGELQAAVAAGYSAEGLRHLGQALHTLEDFFAHSNFCEVALYGLEHRDVIVWTAPVRSRSTHEWVPPVVTGVFGRPDSTASMLYVLAEKLRGKDEPSSSEEPPWWAHVASILVGSILHGANETVLAHGQTASAFVAFWDKEGETMIRLAYQAGMLPGQRAVQDAASLAAFIRMETVDRLKRFVSYVLASLSEQISSEMLDYARRYVSTPSAVLADLGHEIGHLETVEGTGMGFATHTQMAKDHDDHPLHDLAAQLATLAVQDVVRTLRAAWEGRAAGADVQRVALSYLVHPFLIAKGTPQATLFEAVRSWAGGNAAALRQVSDRTWIERDRERWQDLQTKARLLMLCAGADPDPLFDSMRQMLQGANSAAR